MESVKGCKRLGIEIRRENVDITDKRILRKKTPITHNKNTNNKICSLVIRC